MYYFKNTKRIDISDQFMMSRTLTAMPHFGTAITVLKTSSKSHLGFPSYELENRDNDLANDVLLFQSISLCALSEVIIPFCYIFWHGVDIDL